MGKSLFDDGEIIPEAFVEDTAKVEAAENEEEKNQEMEEAQISQEPEDVIENAEADFDDEAGENLVEERLTEFQAEQSEENQFNRKQDAANAKFEEEYLSAQGQADPLGNQTISGAYKQQTQLTEVDPDNDPKNIALYARGAYNPQSRFRNTRPYEIVWSNLETPIEHEVANLFGEVLNQATDLVGDDSVTAQLVMGDFQHWIATMRAKLGFERLAEITTITKSSETKKFAKQQKTDKTGFGLDTFKRQKED